MYVIIDIGNTRIKTAVFKGDKLYRTKAFDKAFFQEEIYQISSTNKIDKAIVSAVGKLSETDRQFLSQHLDYFELNSGTSIPFKNQYGTPKTLGVDRIALAAAAVTNFPKENVLILDAGTCLTYDFVSKDASYLGGAISPGIGIRYKSLADYTENLPLLNKTAPISFIGSSTAESIHSGVVNGICREIDGIIEQYRETYEKLTIVLTGGDANFLSSQLKSSIFVRPFFVLEGLYSILKYNL